ncbi:MAG TPA: hypothetical protein PKN33_01940 [Phycisphaerae bacterium]|nr:hypothetical protein [Phycisphaerae bacterium]
MKMRMHHAIAVGMSGIGLIGCQQKSTSVRVCFSPPSSHSELVAQAQHRSGSRLAADHPTGREPASGDPTTGDGFVEDLTPSSTDSTSIVLYGDGFPRREVRDLDLALAPGSYAFQCRFVKAEDNLSGTLRVHHPEDELWQTLQKWRADVPDQRRRLAYEFELQRNGDRFDSTLLTSLQTQLAALDSFDHQLKSMVSSDVRHRESQPQSQQNTIAIFEPEPAVGRSASMAAFLAADVSQVRSSQPVCRVLLSADQDEIDWKKQSLNQLIEDAVQLRASIRDEVTRLEGRKKLAAIVFKSHEGYRRNEESLRAAKKEFGRVSQQLRELRLHALALAMREELFVPGSGDAIAREQSRALESEIRISETALQRAELLFAQSVETNPGRVNLRSAIESHQAELENLRSQLATVEDVRVALNALQSNTPVKRVGTDRVLASANIDPALPHEVLRLLENDALLTVRLESPTVSSSPNRGAVVRRNDEQKSNEVGRVAGDSDVQPVRASVAGYRR